MSQTTREPLDALLNRLRTVAGEAPESLIDRMRPVLDGFFEQFQLVPRREYDAQLASLTKLEEKVGQLEARISELERGN
jgi:BMFP domain-containing protein YqiC